MKTTIRLAVLALLVLGMATLASAGDEAKEIAVSSKVMCAKCTLKKADTTGCQNVLVAKGPGDTTVEYYLVKNEVTEAFGHACKGEKPAAVAGTVEEKDGKMWLTAKKMEETK